jgi:phosphoglycolate phosphatase
MARLWLFDFDGTLVDSEKAIKACYLKVGRELVPERYNFIKTMIIGPTLDESSRMILADKNLHLLEKFKNRFQKLYDDKLVLKTQQYPYVDETLRNLYGQGDNLCIITNKRYYPTYKLIVHYNWQQLFSWVACMDRYPLAQNKSDLISLKNFNHNQYEKIYFVGDTLSDGISAQDQNIPFIQARYGYGRNQDWNDIPIHEKIEQFNQLLKL